MLRLTAGGAKALFRGTSPYLAKTMRANGLPGILKRICFSGRDRLGPKGRGFPRPYAARAQKQGAAQPVGG